MTARGFAGLKPCPPTSLVARSDFRRSPAAPETDGPAVLFKSQSARADARGVHLSRLPRPVVRRLHVEHRHLGPDDCAELDGAVAHRLGVLPRPRLVSAAAADHAASRWSAACSPIAAIAGGRCSASQYVQMATATTLALLVYFDLVTIWYILLLSFTTGLAQAFGGPAYQSLVPSLVDKKDLPNAVALNSIQFNIARVLGPLLFAATLSGRAHWGFDDPQAMAVCFAPQRGLVPRRHLHADVAAREAHPAGGRPSSMRDEMRGGIQYVRQHSELVRADRARGDDDVPGICGADIPADLHEDASSRGTPRPTATCSRSPAPARSSAR